MRLARHPFLSVQLDLQAIRRAEHERDPNYQPGLRARITKSFTEEGLMPASRGNTGPVKAPSANACVTCR